MSACLVNLRFLSGSAVLRAAVGQAVKKAEVQHLPHGFRRVTPFACFFKEHLDKGGQQKPTELMKSCSAEWRNLSDNAKKKYEDMAAKTGKERAAKFAALSIEEQQKLIEEEERISEARKERKHKKMSRENKEHEGRSKPLSGYNIFMKEKLTGHHPKEGEAQKDVLLKAAAEWKQLSEEMKNKYNQCAKAEATTAEKKAEDTTGKQKLI